MGDPLMRTALGSLLRMLLLRAHERLRRVKNRRSIINVRDQRSLFGHRVSSMVSIQMSASAGAATVK